MVEPNSIARGFYRVVRGKTKGRDGKYEREREKKWMLEDIDKLMIDCCFKQANASNINNKRRKKS